MATPEREEPMLQSRYQQDYLTKVLLPEVRGMVFESQMAAQRVAILLPYRVDHAAEGPIPARRSSHAIRSSIVPSNRTLKALCKQARAEYLPVFNRKVLDMEIDEIRVVILDLDFDNLLDFLHRITPIGRTRIPNVRLEVRIVMSYNFGDNFIDDHSSTSLDRFLRYQDAEEYNGTRVHFDYTLESIHPAREADIYHF